MAKTNVSTLSAASIVIEDQVDQDAGTTTLGSTTVGTLALGAGNAVSVSAATASTHKVAIDINGTTYYILVSNV